MYSCAKCDRVFRYREDSEIHTGLCDIARYRKFKITKQAGPSQTTIVPFSGNIDVVAAVLQLTTEITAMRTEMTAMRTEINKLKRNDAARGKRNIVTEMRARPPPAISFKDWLDTIFATELHLYEVMRANLIDGLEAVIRDALKTPNPPLTASPGEKPCVYFFAPASDTQPEEWRKMGETEYEYLRIELTRKLLARFDVWQTDNARLIENSETENQRNIACMSKIYGSRGPTPAHRAAEFKRKVQQVVLN